MRQLTASELREVATDIEVELARLNTLEQQIEQAQTELNNYPDLANVFYESLALKLHNFYTGCERIFQIIASELNGGLPSQYDWHRRLLNRMATAHQERPAVLTKETAQSLAEYLAFRHVVRIIYGFELDAQRVERLVKEYYSVWHPFKRDIDSFLTWLNTFADKLESFPDAPSD